MHEAALYRAAQPEPTVILGMLLRPFSIGHMLALSGDGLIAGSSSGSLTPTQLTTAVLTCSHSWSEAAGIYEDRLINFKFWIWKRRVRSAARRHLQGGPAYFAAEAARFDAYLVAGAAEFPVSDVPRPDRPSAGRLPGCPFLLRLQQWLMTHFRLSESEAWDYPFGLAKMRWECHWEMEGGMDIANEHEHSFDRYIMEQEALGSAQVEAMKGN